jgi:hypothetical protein
LKDTNAFSFIEVGMPLQSKILVLSFFLFFLFGFDTFFPFIAVILYDIVQTDAAVLDSFDANFVLRTKVSTVFFMLR